MPGHRITGLHDALVARFADVGNLDAGEAAAQALLGDADWIATLPHPLGSPRGTGTDRAPGDIVLLDAPAARVTMGMIGHCADEARALPTTVVVDGRVSWIRYLRAGHARLWRWRADLVDPRWHGGTAAPVRPLSVQPLDDGAIVRIDGRRDAVLLLDATADIVSVTVTLLHGAAPFLREYDRIGGDLVRLATLDDDATCSATLLGLLDELQRGDATAFDAVSRDPVLFEQSEALRAWLASDARNAQSDPDRTRLAQDRADRR